MMVDVSWKVVVVVRVPLPGCHAVERAPPKVSPFLAGSHSTSLHLTTPQIASP